jgi:hypothetical protein
MNTIIWLDRSNALCRQIHQRLMRPSCRCYHRTRYPGVCECVCVCVYVCTSHSLSSPACFCLVFSVEKHMPGDSFVVVQVYVHFHVCSWLRSAPDQEIPLLAERTRLLREVGDGLTRFCSGSAAQLVRSANHSAERLVELVTAYFPGFRDSMIYQGHQVFSGSPGCVGGRWRG